MRYEVLKQIASLDNTNIEEFGRQLDEILENEKIRLVDHSGLTPREKEIILLVASGLSNQEIANKLFISRRTVEIHRANAQRKLHLKSQTEQLVDYVKKNKV